MAQPHSAELSDMIRNSGFLDRTLIRSRPSQTLLRPTSAPPSHLENPLPVLSKRSIRGHMAVKGLTAHADLSAKVPHLGLGFTHRCLGQPDLGGGHSSGATALPTTGPSTGQSSNGPLSNQFPLVRGQACEDSENHLPSSGGCINFSTLASQDPEANTSPFKIVHGVYKMAKVSAKTIKFPAEEQIPRPRRLEHSRQPRAIIPFATFQFGS